MNITTKKALVIGCGAFALLALAVVAAVVLFAVHISKGVQDVTVTVKSPPDVVVGRTFDLEVIVKNERSGEVLSLSDVDIAEDYLAGFTVSAVKPAAKSNMHVPFDNSRSYTFDLPVAAGATQRFLFTLQAEKPGVYRGDVDVCEGVRFVTGIAQTVVREKE